MYERILVPVDGSLTSDAGLAEAIKLAKLTGARLQLLHVVDDMPFVLGTDGFGTLSADVVGMIKEAGMAVLTKSRAVVEKFGVPVETVLFDSFEGRLSQRVAEQAVAWKADLLVLGTHGRRGVQRMVLGSGAEQIVRSSPVPVLLVRGPAAD